MRRCYGQTPSLALVRMHPTLHRIFAPMEGARAARSAPRVPCVQAARVSGMLPCSLSMALLLYHSCFRIVAGLWPRNGYWIQSESSDPSSIATVPRDPWSAARVGASRRVRPSAARVTCRARTSARLVRRDFSSRTLAMHSVPCYGIRLATLLGAALHLHSYLLESWFLFTRPLAVLVFFVGGTITGGLFRMSNLALWALMCAQVRFRDGCLCSLARSSKAFCMFCMQVVSDAATVASPSLPPLVAALYRGTAVLQLQGVLSPPACTGALPFGTDISTTSRRPEFMGDVDWSVLCGASALPSLRRAVRVDVGHGALPFSVTICPSASSMPGRHSQCARVPQVLTAVPLYQLALSLAKPP